MLCCQLWRQATASRSQECKRRSSVLRWQGREEEEEREKPSLGMAGSVPGSLPAIARENHGRNSAHRRPVREHRESSSVTHLW